MFGITRRKSVTSSLRPTFCLFVCLFLSFILYFYSYLLIISLVGLLADSFVPSFPGSFARSLMTHKMAAENKGSHFRCKTVGDDLREQSIPIKSSYLLDYIATSGGCAGEARISSCRLSYTCSVSDENLFVL